MEEAKNLLGWSRNGRERSRPDGKHAQLLMGILEGKQSRLEWLEQMAWDVRLRDNKVY